MEKPATTPAQQIIEEIFSLYEKHGGEDYIGEPVSQLEHMVQSAQLAQQEGYGEEVILAAFFHDIGHLCAQADKTEQMGGYGVLRHEKIGADYLRSRGFSETIARLVEYHVQAKRYLTYALPSYYEKLSEASKRTLEYQGSRMNVTEAQAFTQDPLFATSIQMRKWDEQAKEEHFPIPDLTYLKEMAKRHLQL
jgi:phosphonate degradation associated HDIG domain protein